MDDTTNIVTAIIDIRELVKIYPGGRRGNIVAVNGVSMTIRPGEIIGLVGPNGAGKTTLVKAVLGLVRIDKGEVYLNGLPPANPESREKVGYLAENHRYPSHLTGNNLLRLTGEMLGMSASSIRERTEALLLLVGMSKWGETKVSKYSKGMGQRIGLAQALMGDPDLLLLDEPTDGIDPVGKIEIREVLKQLRQQGKTILLNSHLLSEVEAIADRVAMLSQGKLVRIATMDELTVKGMQFEIVADLGNEILEIPPEIGKVITIAAKGMIVELKNESDINGIIDILRTARITIHSIAPRKMTLEQSFIETIAKAEQN